MVYWFGYRIQTHKYRFFSDLVEPAGKDKDTLVNRIKKLLKVDSDDTEELHNKYRETSKDREEKIKLFEEQLNIKVMKYCFIIHFIPFIRFTLPHLQRKAHCLIQICP